MKLATASVIFVLAIGLSRAGVAQTAAAVPGSATQVNVELSNYAFAPSKIVLDRGKLYRLHLVNSSTKGHNFSAPELFAAATIQDLDRSKIDAGAIEVAAGQSVDVELTPSTAGKYSIECTHFMHSMFGMTATVDVE